LALRSWPWVKCLATALEVMFSSLGVKSFVTATEVKSLSLGIKFLATALEVVGLLPQDLTMQVVPCLCI